jgi:hypothetical protein
MTIWHRYKTMISAARLKQNTYNTTRNIQRRNIQTDIDTLGTEYNL